MDKGGVKATKIIEILKNTRAGLGLSGSTQDAGPQDSTQEAGLPDQDSTQDAGLQDSTQAPKPGGLLAVPRDIMNIVASNRSQARNGLTNTEAAIELLQKIDWKYTFLQDKDGHLTDLLFMPGNCSRSQWFHDTWHGQLVADLYNIFLVSAEKIGETKVLIRAPTGYTSVNAVLDAIQSGNPLIGLLFDRNCEHFDALQFSTEAWALLADRAYSTTMLSSVARGDL